MKGYVYLINEQHSNRYKIGVTTAKDPNKRLKTLQTGNSLLLLFDSLFETDYPHKLEKMLHTKFINHRTVGEWFELEDETVIYFKEICEELDRTVQLLKNHNPYF